MTDRPLKPWPEKYAAAVAKANLTERQARVLNDWINHRSIRRIALALETTEHEVRRDLDDTMALIHPHMPKEAAA